MRHLSLVLLVLAGCGGAAQGETAAEPVAVPEAYDEARTRLSALTEGRLVVEQTDDVTQLIEAARVAATSLAEETVAIVRLFEQVVTDDGERWRARCLVGIAAANRALAVLIRNLEYTMPREVEAQLEVLDAEDPAAAAGAREEIELSIAEALESRALPLDRNECTALRGAVEVLAEWRDPEIDDEALRTRIGELPDCR